jgi:hypothetical protein
MGYALDEVTIHASILRSIGKSQNPLVFCAAIVVACAETAVENAIPDHVIGDAEDRNGDGLLRASPEPFTRVLGLRNSRLWQPGARHIG